MQNPVVGRRMAKPQHRDAMSGAYVGTTAAMHENGERYRAGDQRSLLRAARVTNKVAGTAVVRPTHRRGFAT